MLSELLGGREPLRLVVTDSGLGGLSICAELEKRLRDAAAGRSVRLIYVNAWPDAKTGYNDLPDPAARARVLDRALARMAAYRPDLIVIACNTLSVLFDLTEFARSPAVPAVGIVEAGVEMFQEALSREPGGELVLFGTRTTVESGEHIGRLARRGIAAGRMSAVSCHGLAAAIDNDPDGPAVAGLVASCVSGMPRAAGSGGGSGTLYAGLACTHYGYVRDVFRAALAARTGRRIVILDPNARLVDDLMSGIGARAPARGGKPGGSAGEITVEVVSKIELGEAKRKAVARRLEPVSPRTARALVAYTWTPGLF
jgi:glutamate racemase